MPNNRQQFSTVKCPFGCDWTWTWLDYMPPYPVQPVIIPANNDDSVVVMAEVNGLIPQVTVRVLRRHGGQLSPNWIFQKSHACPKITRG